MYVLGLHTGHNATVTLVKDGKIIACTSEERFTRKKNYSGWPTQALAWALGFAGITITDIDLVVVPSKDARTQMIHLHSPGMFFTGTSPVVKKSVKQSINDGLKRKFVKYPKLWKRYQAVQEAKYGGLQRKKLETKVLAEYAHRLGCPKERIIFLDHHEGHAISPAWNLPRDRKTLIFTLDGEGEDVCATVGVFDGTTLTRIAETKKEHGLGWLYFHCTRFLGMKGSEHEFKVMGLAPYSKSDYAQKVTERLRKVIWLDPKDKLRFDSAFPTYFADVWLHDNLRGERFDNIAGGIQLLTEELILEWVKTGIERTGIRDVAVSGGVFMNVKACMHVVQMPEVASLFVMPSAGDESLSIGAAWKAYKLSCERTGVPFAPQPLTDLYLGKEWTDGEVKAYLDAERIGERYDVRYVKDIEEEVAKLLAKNEVVARCSGRAEWGARALGNRSIMANPSSFETVKLINEMIKNRDFWMPFTPSMLDTDAKRYFLNPKNIFAPYMCITFDSTPLAQEHLPAAMHPYDKTIRPQVVIESWNPSYYRIIKAFKKRTGIGAVLNTSFNLHGEPNVNSPADAIHTLDNSGLRNLVLGNFLVQKRKG